MKFKITTLSDGRQSAKLEGTSVSSAYMQPDALAQWMKNTEEEYKNAQAEMFFTAPFIRDPQEAARVSYELARGIGEKRFGSECQHEHANNGRCPDCLRKVI